MTGIRTSISLVHTSTQRLEFCVTSLELYVLRIFNFLRVLPYLNDFANCGITRST
jgi:hypothetical protein